MPELENLLIYKDNIDNGSIPFIKEEYKILCLHLPHLLGYRPPEKNRLQKGEQICLI